MAHTELDFFLRLLYFSGFSASASWEYTTSSTGILMCIKPFLHTTCTDFCRRHTLEAGCHWVGFFYALLVSNRLLRPISTTPLWINDDERMLTISKLLKFVGSEAMYADLGHFSHSSIAVCNDLLPAIVLQELHITHPVVNTWNPC